MDFSLPQFTTIHHRNVWGEWEFVFEGEFLCGLRFIADRDQLSTGHLTECVFERSIQEHLEDKKITKVYKKVSTQLLEYLEGKRNDFDLLLKLHGTPFQIKVWEALLQIPYGETWTYKQLAEFIDEPKAVRAVGGALHTNPIQIILPCHRVIGKDGSMTGYALGIRLKQKLLELEGAMPLTFLE